MTVREEFAAGVRDVSPVLLANGPFGVVAGVAAVEAGFSPLEAVAMSVVVFAGAAQLAAVDLLAGGASAVVATLTGLVVNARLLMYSASIAPHFRDLSARWKWLCGYLLTDPAYALSVVRYRERGGSRWYYLGAAASIWVVWQTATVAGVAFGEAVPRGWGLEFAVPLVFLALLVPAATDRATAVAGVVAGVAAVAGAGLPLDLGTLLASVVGIAAGIAAQRGVA